MESYYQIILYPILLAITIFVWKILIKPYLDLQFYKKQGLKTIFVPVIGTVLHQIQNMNKHGDFYHDWKKFSNLDPKPEVIVTHIGPYIILLLQDQNLIKEFLVNHENYVKSDLFILAKVLVRTGVAMSEGKIWKKHRKIVSMAFHYNLVRGMVPEIHKLSKGFLEKWQEQDLSNFNFLDNVQSITAEAIGSLFFGESLARFSIDGEPISNKLRYIVRETGDISLSALFLIFGLPLIKLGLFKRHRLFIKTQKQVRKCLGEIIKRKIESFNASKSIHDVSEGRSMIEIFNSLRKSDTIEEKLSDEEMVDEFITFSIAGMDTTAHLINMTSYYLLKNPEAKKKLIAELKEHFPKNGEIDLDSLNKLDYLHAVVKEGVRMSSPAPNLFERQALKTHKLGNIVIKKGDNLNINLIGNHFDSRLFEEPEIFMPERWLDPNSLTNKTVKSQSMAFLPFSAGGRNCIGQQIAMIEARLVIANFVMNYDYELKDPNYRLVMNGTLLYEPIHPIIYKLTKIEK